MFDGAGFVRGIARKGRALAGRSALVVGAGGVGWAIAASLAAAGVGALGVFDAYADAAAALREPAARALSATRRSTPARTIPAGYDVVVNATPLGMKEGDPLPVDVRVSTPAHLRRRSGDEGGDHAVPARGAGEGLQCRWARTCCSR